MHQAMTTAAVTDTTAGQTPLLGFCAFSGTGKTTLLTKLIPLMRERGLRLGVIKHAHHSFDVDQPGKDSYRLRHAGAEQMLIASRRRLALMRELDDLRREPTLSDLLPYLDGAGLDLILVEGFKRAPLPKIELHRPSLGHPLMHPQDPNVIAVASDAPLTPTRPLPLLDLNRPEAILAFIQGWLRDRG